jgi:hypothetical protein
MLHIAAVLAHVEIEPRHGEIVAEEAAFVGVDVQQRLTVTRPQPGVEAAIGEAVIDLGRIALGAFTVAREGISLLSCRTRSAAPGPENGQPGDQHEHGAGTQAAYAKGQCGLRIAAAKNVNVSPGDQTDQREHSPHEQTEKPGATT